MLNLTRTVSFLILLNLLAGCGTVVKQLDSSWLDYQTVYNKSTPLPPLEISPELASSATLPTKDSKL
jgi:uncharacterized lipoprotein